MTIITSKANSVVKMPRNYTKKYRKSAYLIEGWHLFEEAVQAGVTIEKIFALEKYRDQLVRLLSQTVWVSEDILLDLADSQTPTGNCFRGSKRRSRQADFSQGKFLFLEDVQILVMWERSFGLRMQQVLLE